MAGSLAVTAFSILGTGTAAQAQLYGIDNTSQNFGSGPIYRIDTTTGAATLAGTIVGVNNVTQPGLEILNGIFYASNVFVDGAFRFGRVNLGTGAFTSLYSYQAASLQGLAVNPTTGLFYSVEIKGPNDYSLISITTSGITSTIASVAVPIVGMAYDSGGDILYAVDDNNLYTVNTTSGVLTQLGSHGQGFSSLGLAYDDATDTLYMNRGSSNNAALFTLNKTNGTATLVGLNGPVGVNGIAGLAFAQARSVAAPEPGTCLLLAAGLLPVVARRSFQRRRKA
jgi:hypothetical protein